MADTVEEDFPRFIERSVNNFETSMSEWRAEAWNAYDFVAGRQYTQEEADKLKDRLRPAVVFNFVAKFIASVSGTEIANEMNVRYYPTAVTRSGPVEAVQEVIGALIDPSNDIEHSEAFADNLICGYGWLSCNLSEEDGYYCIKEPRVDPFEMGWDPNARKQNLTDASFIYCRKYMDKEDVEAEWPDKIDELKYSGTEVYGHTYAQLNDTQDYRGVGVRDYKGQLAVIHFQRKKYVRYVKFTAGGQDQSVSENEFISLKHKLEQSGAVVQKISTHVQVEYWQSYFCRGILLEEEEKINGFSYFCCTGKRDVIKDYYYGLLRDAIDPQRWTNKFFGNLMHTMSTAGQGVFLEKSAVLPKDMQNFETDYARPDKVKWLADGAISQGRIKFAEQTPLPAGLPQLLDFSVSAIPNTLGINLEFLGMASRTQSGPVEASRKRAGLAIIGKFFQSRRMQMRELGVRRLDYMQHYVPQKTIEALCSDLNKPYLEATKDIYFEHYHVKVDEAPNSADVKTDVWTIIIELIPYLMNVKLPPQFLVTLLKYSPLPSHIVDELWKIINKPPDPEQQKVAQLQTEKLAGEAANQQSQALLNVAKAKSEGATDVDAIGEVINRLLEMQKAQLEAGYTADEHAMKMQELATGARTDAVKAAMQVAAQHAKAKIEIEREKAKPSGNGT